MSLQSEGQTPGSESLERAGLLMLAVGEDRQHGGNDGYDHEPGHHYSWDNRLPNQAAVAVGDCITLYDGGAADGWSSFEGGVARPVGLGVRPSEGARRHPRSWAGVGSSG